MCEMTMALGERWSAREECLGQTDDSPRGGARRGVSSAARAPDDRAGGFSLETDPDRDRVSARRRDRHPGAVDRAENLGAARSAAGRREPAGSERPDRDPGRRAIGSGRPHDLLRHHGKPGGQPGGLRRSSRPRHRARLRAAVAGRLAPFRSRGESNGAGAVASGADRAREGAPGRDPVRIERQRRPPHLSGELLSLQAGIVTRHVPYRGSAPAFTDLISGQVQFVFDALAIAQPHIESRQLRALATTGPKRMAALPDVPAAKETLPSFEVVNWYGMVVRAGTPAAIVSRLNQEVADALRRPDVAERAASLGLDLVGSSADELAVLQRDEIKKWGEVIRAAKIKIE